MATKCEWEGKPAYIEDDKMILQLNSDTKLWDIYHKQTGQMVMGPGVVFKQKKHALKYAQELIQNLDLNFSDKNGMYDLNGGRDNAVRIRNEAYMEAMKE